MCRTPQISNTCHARAATIEPEEYTGLIDWKNWPIERIWHFLRGTERLIDLIVPAGGLFKSYRWVVMEFIHCEMPVCYQVAKLYKESGRLFLPARRGKYFLTEGLVSQDYWLI